jgi:hypothetical protein
MPGWFNRLLCAGLALAGLTAGACIYAEAASISRNPTMTQTPKAAAGPPLDAAQPARTETATFALG